MGRLEKCHPCEDGSEAISDLPLILTTPPPLCKVKMIYNNIIKGNNKTIMSHHSLEFVLVFIFSIKMSLYLCLNVNE